MYKTKLANPIARAKAVECLRVARETFKRPNEAYGFAITIATNLKQIETDSGNREAASAYGMARHALNKAVPASRYFH